MANVSMAVNGMKDVTRQQRNTGKLKCSIANIEKKVLNGVEVNTVKSAQI